MARILQIFTNIEMWCNWFTRHSDKVEFVGSSPIISTKMKIAGSTPALWTTKFIDTYSNSKAHYW